MWGTYTAQRQQTAVPLCVLPQIAKNHVYTHSGNLGCHRLFLGYQLFDLFDDSVVFPFVMVLRTVSERDPLKQISNITIYVKEAEH